MANGYYNDYDERLLTGGSDTKYEEDPRTVKDFDTENRYPLPPAIKSRTLKWGVVSLVMGILSILLCPIYYVGFICFAVAIVTMVVSRYNLGFFDKLSTIGLILGLVGFVFNVFSVIIQTLNLF
jgi:hypothetical protein